VLTSSCIKDDLSNCGVSLRVKAINASGNDITATGQAGTVILYIFDNNKHFVEEKKISKQDVQNNIPVEFRGKSFTNYWVVVWSNLEDKQQVTDLKQGMLMKEALVQLKENAEAYAINPDDLFHGFSQITTSIQSQTAINNEVVISRKTALLNIVVRGLKLDQSDKYHFKINGASQNAYDFEGKLRGEGIEYKQNGEFNTQGTLFASYPFTVFDLIDGNSFSISIYRDDELLALVHTSSGKPIIPQIGVTNNILIDLTTTLDATIKITDWDVMYYWFEW
jgi:hypothetical protein